MSRARTVWRIDALLDGEAAPGQPWRYVVADMRGAVRAIRRSVAAGADSLDIDVYRRGRMRSLLALRCDTCGEWWGRQRRARLARRLGIPFACQCRPAK